MKLTGRLNETYHPTFLGNRDQPKSEQISVKIRHPSHAARELLSSDIRYRQSESGTEISVRTRHRELIEACVIAIEHLETEMDGLITDGKQLMQARDPRLAPLIDELVVHLKASSELSEEQEKN